MTVSDEEDLPLPPRFPADFLLNADLFMEYSMGHVPGTAAGASRKILIEILSRRNFFPREKQSRGKGGSALSLSSSSLDPLDSRLPISRIFYFIEKPFFFFFFFFETIERHWKKYRSLLCSKYRPFETFNLPFRQTLTNASPRGRATF